MPKKRLNLQNRRVLNSNSRVLGTIVEAGEDNTILVIWDSTFDNEARIYPREFAFKRFQLVLKKDEERYNERYKQVYRPWMTPDDDDEEDEYDEGDYDEDGSDI